MKSFVYLVIISTTSCIGDDLIDDFVEPEIRINNSIDNLQNGASYQFEATYFNNIGISESAEFNWISSDHSIVSILPSGLATGLSLGSVIITVAVTGEFNAMVSFDLSVTEAETTASADMVSGAIQTTSSYVLEGDFTIESVDQGGIIVSFDDNYQASSTLPGLYLYLSNNPNSINGAHEVGMVQVYSGAHTYAVDDVSLSQYGYLLYFCKPFNVKVGDGKF